MIQVDNKDRAWGEFVENQSIQDGVSAVIANSWRRSWPRLNLSQGLKIPCLSADHFMSTQIANFDLISIARPVMEDAYQCMEDSSTAIILVNGAGCALEVLGDQNMLNRLDALGIGRGALLAEERVGTSALGVALIEQTPVQVIGAEHYCRELHELAGVAAPIFDLTGRSLGALGLLTLVENYHPHSLGLVTAMARAIEGQRQSDNLLAEQNSQLAQLIAILSSITDGIAVWNADHRLIQVNTAASRLLGRPIQTLMGAQVERLFSAPPFLARAIRQHEPLNGVEVSLALDERAVNCIINLHFVFNKKNELLWGIITLRPEKDIRRLVQNQVGAKATLTLDDIPGDSIQMYRVRNFVRAAADATASILIRGEAGTGKNALANAIHNASRRHDGPFMIFPCSSIPNELVINELLGYDENLNSARTGSRPSKFELAQAGTLFFQDVDALPLEAQAVLLNVLELGLVQRMESQRPIDVDVRVIASTSAKMEKLISQGSFRADLYYRLSTFTVSIPPLRERRNDIPLVVERVINRLSRQLGYSLTLGDGVMDVFKRYPWTGNVREIEAILGRLAIQVGDAGVIEIKHLPESVRYVNRVPADELTVPAFQSLEDVERETILRTAQFCCGNVVQMSHLLGVSRTTLWRRLKVFRINPQDYRA